MIKSPRRDLWVPLEPLELKVATSPSQSSLGTPHFLPYLDPDLFTRHHDCALMPQWHHSFLMLDSWSGGTHRDPLASSPRLDSLKTKALGRTHWQSRRAPRSSEIDGLAGKAAAWVIAAVQPRSSLLSHVPERKRYIKWFNVHAKAPHRKSTRKASRRRARFNVFHSDPGLNFCILTVGILTPKMHVSKQAQMGWRQSNSWAWSGLTEKVV